jgi:translation initiation factor 1
MAKERKERINVVYSTNPNYKYEYDFEENVQETLAPAKQNLIVRLDKKQRGGKKVTLVQGFEGVEDDLKNLGKSLKNKCGVGGTVKDGEILIQGDFRDKIVEYLVKEGYKAKLGN